MTELLLKGLIGGVIIVLVGLLADNRPVLSGILAVAPITTLFGFYAAADIGADIKKIALTSTVTLIATLLFLVSVYSLSDKVNRHIAIGFGLVLWIVAAFALVYPLYRMGVL